MKKRAFTLAEVLITLGIIGVVAAMTMPTLIQKNEERVTVTKLKKMNSVLNNAFLRAVNEYGTPDTWGITAAPADFEDEEAVGKYYNSIDNVMNKFLPFLKTTFVCYQSDNSCINLEKYKRTRYSLHGAVFDSWLAPRIILADGSSIDVIYFGHADAACNANAGDTPALRNKCGEIVVDINGITPPNTQGKDIFWFYITKNGIIPAGTAADSARSFESYCRMNTTSPYNGYGCTAWVIYNENMDYLRCNDLSWNGKTKCK